MLPLFFRAACCPVRSPAPQASLWNPKRKQACALHIQSSNTIRLLALAVTSASAATPSNSRSPAPCFRLRELGGVIVPRKQIGAPSPSPVCSGCEMISDLRKKIGKPQENTKTQRQMNANRIKQTGTRGNKHPLNRQPESGCGYAALCHSERSAESRIQNDLRRLRCFAFAQHDANSGLLQLLHSPVSARRLVPLGTVPEFSVSSRFPISRKDAKIAKSFLAVFAPWRETETSAGFCWHAGDCRGSHW